MNLKEIFKKGCEERAKWLETAKENMRKSLEDKKNEQKKYHAEPFTLEKLGEECYAYYNDYEEKYLNGGQIYRVAGVFHKLPFCSSSAFVSIEGDCLNLINEEGDYLLTDEEAKRGTWIAQMTEDELNDLVLWCDVNTGNENVFTIKSYKDNYGGIGNMLRFINLPKKKKNVKYSTFTTYYVMLTYMCDGIYKISVPNEGPLTTGPGGSLYLKGIYDIIGKRLLATPSYDSVGLTDKGFYTCFNNCLCGPQSTDYEYEPELQRFFPVCPQLDQEAADRGRPIPQWALGICYYNGFGVTQDYEKAAALFQKSADQGYAGGQCYLGLCYYNGRGVEQDYNKAVEWYRKAAAQDLALAQYNLGWCYENGQGVEQDYSKAMELYRKAAAQGNEKAKENLRRLGESC